MSRGKKVRVCGYDVRKLEEPLCEIYHKGCNEVFKKDPRKKPRKAKTLG